MALSLKNRDWSLLFVEVLVVVVGILIGLQVDDWNQARQDRNDEQAFLEKLHRDLSLAEELSSRLRERRAERVQSMLSASDVLFRRTDREELTMTECRAITWSTAFNFTAPGLPSLDELIGTGRMEIIRDPQLRSALVALRQSREALYSTISEKSSSSNFRFLPYFFPGKIHLEARFNAERDEIVSIPVCNLADMREDPHFLTQFSANIDGYDAYVRDGIIPWISQSDLAHELVDEALGIHHESAESE